MIILWRFAVALALTAAVEGAAMLALGRGGRLGVPARRAAYASLLCNLLTNPLLNLLLLLAGWWLGAAARQWLVLPLELAVVAGEAALYHLLLSWGAKRAVAVSLLLNSLSYLVGLLLFGV